MSHDFFSFFLILLVNPVSSVGGKMFAVFLASPRLASHFLSEPRSVISFIKKNPKKTKKTKQQKQKDRNPKLCSSLPLLADLHASPPVSAGPEEAKPQRAAAAAATKQECQAQAVSMETSSQSGKKTSHSPAHTPPSPSPPPPLPPTTTTTSPPAPLLSPVTEVAAKDTGSAAVVLEDDKDRIVVEIMQMYGRQQEKLNSTLHKQLQLEMVSFGVFFWVWDEQRKKDE